MQRLVYAPSRHVLGSVAPARPRTAAAGVLQACRGQTYKGAGGASGMDKQDGDKPESLDRGNDEYWHDREEF